jgi:hypothetical protein
VLNNGSGPLRTCCQCVWAIEEVETKDVASSEERVANRSGRPPLPPSMRAALSIYISTYTVALQVAVTDDTCGKRVLGADLSVCRAYDVEGCAICPSTWCWPFLC